MRQLAANKECGEEVMKPRIYKVGQKVVVSELWPYIATISEVVLTDRDPFYRVDEKDALLPAIRINAVVDSGSTDVEALHPSFRAFFDEGIKPRSSYSCSLASETGGDSISARYMPGATLIQTGTAFKEALAMIMPADEVEVFMSRLRAMCLSDELRPFVYPHGKPTGCFVPLADLSDSVSGD